jgi:hypothetical protein
MSLARSIDAGLSYLRLMQNDAGFWADWRLPPGESRMWTTAYIGYRLSSLSRGRRTAIEDGMTRAAGWLRESEYQGGGWGYAESTGPDADSTSLALLFLRGLGGCAADGSYRRLCEHQQADGGFATYTRESSYGAWVLSHPDVTAVALLALLSAPFPSLDRVATGLRYVRSRRRDDGLWNSFWWTTCLYATEAMLAFLRAAGEPVECAGLLASLREVPARTAFESALRLLCLVHLDGAHASEIVDEASGLSAAQLPDGSWPSCPMLRLTERHVSEPWTAQDAGPVFADERRLFTTATVLAALAALEAATERAGRNR